MDEKVYRVLEFDKIRNLLKQEARSPMAAKAAGEIVPSDRKYEIEEWLQETDEAVSVILAKGSIPLGGLCDVKRKARYAEKGRVLSMADLLDIASSLRAAQNVRLFLLDGGVPDIPKLREYAGFLTPEEKLAEKIGQCIEGEDRMADNASPKLFDLRRKILRLHDSARARIQSMINSPSTRDLLQDTVVTMREGRLVIPVKQEHRARFPGLIHDRSSTGATLFIEPQAVVEINNEIRDLELREREEIQRILAELSADTAVVVRPIIRNQKYLTRLDLIFAKARLSVNCGGCAAELSTEGVLDIRQGRHPLIDPASVVPLDITAGQDYRTLIITGPNTGGKTVALKTAGLLMLMTQAGMHIPAGPGSVIPVMMDVFADIGDEQSIEQSLSTFSSHMKNIVEITAKAGPETFILLDELGAGTDPAEGAALAISILEHLSATGALIFATTHYSELKKYALSTEGVENASMEFDVETLSPTYRLRIGLPGKSNAFEISRKLGIDEGIIRRASEILGRKDLEFEHLISVIEEEKKSSEEELLRIRAMRDELERERREWEQQRTAAEEKSRKALEKAREEARNIVIDARQFADEVKEELKERSRTADVKSAAAAQREIRKRIRGKADQYRQETVPEFVENAHPASRHEIRLGDRVNVVSLGQKGVVASLPDSRDELQVQIGLMKLRVPLSDITKFDDHGVQKRFEKTSYGKMYRDKAMAVSPEINVIGKTLDEAVIDVDKYLDDAYMSGLGQVRVIHGRGSGVLQKGLHDLFRRHAHVESFAFAGYREGGEGATVVTLRQ